jgi:hypothetical protein
MRTLTDHAAEREWSSSRLMYGTNVTTHAPQVGIQVRPDSSRRLDIKDIRQIGNIKGPRGRNTDAISLDHVTMVTMTSAPLVGLTTTTDGLTDRNHMTMVLEIKMIHIVPDGNPDMTTNVHVIDLGIGHHHRADIRLATVKVHLNVTIAHHLRVDTKMVTTGITKTTKIHVNHEVVITNRDTEIRIFGKAAQPGVYTHPTASC